MPKEQTPEDRCANEQHAWGADHRGWRCQLCAARRTDNPQKTHAELRKMHPDPWTGGRFR